MRSRRAKLTISPKSLTPWSPLRLTTLWAYGQPLLVTGTIFVRFEYFKEVIMKNVVFWDVTLCGCSNNRRFGGT
jgi:hypothetical protein